MADLDTRHSPLAHLGVGAKAQAELGDAGVGLWERDYRQLIDVRCELDKYPAAREAFERVMGFRLPETPNTVAGKGTAEALWLGPNEWQVVIHDSANGPARETYVPKLREAFQNVFAAVVDVSHAQAVIGATGPMLRETLERAVPLDMHPRVFQPGQVKQTLFGRHCNATLHVRDETPVIDIYTRRGFADYVYTYLEDCARGAVTRCVTLAREQSA